MVVMSCHESIMSDSRRRSFLDALDASDSVTPNDWECKFIESNMDREEFTEAQRAAIDRMIHRYGHKLSY